jgi:2-dehydro-3-deoxy-D-gluconate 5-dehydrogenase
MTAVNLFDLTGKVAIVTGGNGGIGLGMAIGLAHAGASVAIVGRNATKSAAAAARIAEETRAETLVVAADVSRSADVERAVEEVVDRFGRIDILVNNAGITVRKPPQEMTPEEWNSVLATNVTGPFLMARAVYPKLKKTGGGKILNIGSLASNFGIAYASAYAASKGAIVQLTKSLALSWAADNIQVNAILPGWFETDMTAKAREHVPGLNERVITRTPLGRWAKPSDMAGTAVWLASPASDFVTGIAVLVDGGYSIAP